eukprot:GHVP01066520.1.p1 GENE.GHVP01066520.1~~GHVP01066520.1.p1  ORF type:complete len:358 (+),score=88.55 GHVP01066520.1:63-1136(+)
MFETRIVSKIVSESDDDLPIKKKKQKSKIDVEKKKKKKVMTVWDKIVKNTRYISSDEMKKFESDRLERREAAIAVYKKSSSRMKSTAANELLDLFGDDKTGDQAPVSFDSLFESNERSLSSNDVESNAVRMDSEGNFLVEEELTPSQKHKQNSDNLFDDFTREGQEIIRETYNENFQIAPFHGAYKTTPSSTWTKSQYHRLKVALRCYGTDLMLVASALPEFTEAQVKTKFKKLQKTEPEILEKLLKNKLPPLRAQRIYEELHGIIDESTFYDFEDGLSSSDEDENRALVKESATIKSRKSSIFENAEMETENFPLNNEDENDIATLFGSSLETDLVTTRTNTANISEPNDLLNSMF